MRKSIWPAIALAAASLLLPYSADSASMEYFVNGIYDYDYGIQTDLPPTFGEGEFTLELWIRPNDSFPVGSTAGGANQRQNWSNADNAPYSSESWWFAGNFLLDGHNNNNNADGTFSLQFYGGGRVRWLFGDGSYPGPGSNWSVGAYPASTAPSLLDGAWHQLTLVRRWTGSSSSQLELWIDGALIATEVTPVRTDMRQWWDSWPGYPAAEPGWFWGVEKQAAVGALEQYEDYKGLLDEVRFWDRAKSSAEISADFALPVSGSETGLVGVYHFSEGSDTSTCDSLSASRCISIVNSPAGVWNSADAPLSGGSGDTEAPTAPGSLDAQAISTSQINLTWTVSSDNVGVTAYDIRRDGALVDSVSSTSYSDTGLAANTTYSYTVTARDAAGNVSTASSASATTLAGADTEAPTAPGSLTAQGISATQIDLSWNASTDNVGVTAYDVRRDGALVGSVSSTSFSDTGLTASTTYSYTVTARDAAGNASTASGASGTTLAGADTEAPTAPGSLTAQGVSVSQIDLSWSASTDNVGVTAYDVRRDGVLVDSVSATSFSDTGLTANTTYSYTVSARDAAGNASPASSASGTTLAAADTEAPTAPGSLTAQGISPSRIDLSWSASTDNVGVAAYDIRRDGALIDSVTTTSYSDTALSANTAYSYTVTARDAAGNESTASSASATTLAAPDTEAPTAPASLTVQGVSASRIDLDWNAATDNVGVTGYDIRRDGALIASVSTTSYSDTGLAAATNYAYEVTARDAAGNVSAAAGASATTSPAAGDSEAPTTPGNLSATVVSTSRIDLSWTASSDNVGVVEYSIRRDGVAIATTADTNYADTGLLANTTYNFEVIALDAAGNASLPANVSATTDATAPPPPPPPPPVTPPTSDSGGGGSTDWLLLLLLAMVAASAVRQTPGRARSATRICPVPS